MLCIASLRMQFESQTDERDASSNSILIVSESELGCNTKEARPNICCANVEGAIDYKKEFGWFNKFRSSFQNFDDKTRSCGPKTVDFVVLFIAINANPVSNARGVSGRLCISWVYAIIWQPTTVLVNRKPALLQLDNARPRTARTIQNKLQKLDGIELMLWVWDPKSGRKVVSSGATWWLLFWILVCCSNLTNKAKKLPKYYWTFDLSKPRNQQ